jgi:hypothetical protein
VTRNESITGHGSLGDIAGFLLADCGISSSLVAGHLVIVHTFSIPGRFHGCSFGFGQEHLIPARETFGI